MARRVPHLARGQRADRRRQRPERRHGGMFEPGGADYLDRARRWQALKFDAGFARITWEPEFGGRNGTTMQQMIFGQEEGRFDVPERGLRDRSRHDRPDAARVRHRRAEAALPHQAAPRRGDLEPAVQRARRGFRRRVALDDRGARRRGVGDQRPEGLDVGRAVLRLRRDHLPHQPRRREAQGHHRVHRRHAGARRHDQAAQADERRRVVQRGVLRRRARAGRPRARRRQRGLDRRDHHAHERAGRDRLGRRRRRTQLRAATSSSSPSGAA